MGILSGLHEPLGPPDLPRATSLDRTWFHGLTHRNHQIPIEQWASFKKIAQGKTLDPLAAICTAFCTILAQWSKTPIFSIKVLGNRWPIDLKTKQRGNFVNHFSLEIQFSTQEIFTARIRQLQQSILQEIENESANDSPVCQELTQLKSKHDISEMSVVFNNDFGYLPDKDSWILIKHQVEETQDGLIIYWDAQDEYFPDRFLDDMWETYTFFLENLSNYRELWDVHPMALIPEKQLILRNKINLVSNKNYLNSLLHAPFFESVKKYPSNTALISENQRFSYHELLNYTCSLGNQLRKSGVQRNELIAVFAEKGWEQVVSVLAILYAGAAYLPISVDVTQERLEFLMDHSDVRFVLTQSSIVDKVKLPKKVKTILVDNQPVFEQNVDKLQLFQTPQDLAYVIYTSGSTGVPKGVVISHQSAANTILDINNRFEVNENDRLLSLSELNFDLSVYDIFGILAVGGCIVIPNAKMTKNPVYLDSLIQKHQITIWNSVPAYLAIVSEFILHRESKSLSSLRLAMMSGDWIPINLPSTLKILNKQLKIVSLGGATEASIWSIHYIIKAVDPNWSSIPYGFPLSNQKFFVLDAHLRPKPNWVPGELYIGGIGVGEGYYKDVDSTEKSFLVHPTTQERLYKTGDWGRYKPNGCIEFLGRDDLQVKIQGFRVELGEIEHCASQFPKLDQAVALAKSKRNREKQLVLFFSLRHERRISTSLMN